MIARASGRPFVFALVGTLTVAGIWFFGRSARLKPLPNLGAVPNFRLVNAWTGEPWTREKMQGSIWIAGFIFTRCTGPCPLISAGMQKLSSHLPEGVNLISFSVDPDWDQPAVLRQYAEGLNADPQRWVFVTGQFQEVRNLMRDGFHFALEINEGASVGDRITHTASLVLMDVSGGIRGYYNGLDPLALEQLRQDAAQLAKK